MRSIVPSTPLNASDAVLGAPQTTQSSSTHVQQRLNSVRTVGSSGGRDWPQYVLSVSPKYPARVLTTCRQDRIGNVLSVDGEVDRPVSLALSDWHQPTFYGTLSLAG